MMTIHARGYFFRVKRLLQNKASLIREVFFEPEYRAFDEYP
jgi:hypothetical protein